MDSIRLMYCLDVFRCIQLSTASATGIHRCFTHMRHRSETDEMRSVTQKKGNPLRKRRERTPRRSIGVSRRLSAATLGAIWWSFLKIIFEFNLFTDIDGSKSDSSQQQRIRQKEVSTLSTGIRMIRQRESFSPRPIESNLSRRDSLIDSQWQFVTNRAVSLIR